MAVKNVSVAGKAFFASALVTLFTTAFATGCGGSSDTASDTATGFQGTYVSNGTGSVDAMRFDTNGYALIPSGCAKASCTDVGTYTADSSGGSLSLKSATTGDTRTMTIQVTDTEPAADSTSTTSSVHVEDLVMGTGTPIIQSSGQPLVNVVSKALVNGQQVTLVADLSWCARNIPTGYGDPTGSKQAAYWAACPNGPR